jgi:sulfatase modifying factor 1
MSSKTSSPVSLFEKVLRAFETGGYAYADVLAHLQQLLATGASPTELLELLRRRELIEPLPEYAYAELLGILTDAIDLAAVPGSDTPPVQIPDSREPAPPSAPATAPIADEALKRSYERSREAESAAVARATALAADLAATRAALESEKSRVRELDKALAERTAVTEASRSQVEAARSQIEEARHEAESFRAETRTVRDSLAARDAQLSALQQEHAKVARALDAREKSGTQLDVDLQAVHARATALAADVAAARTALESERGRVREVDKALAERTAVAEASRREAESFQAETRTVRDSLAARDAKFAALQQEHAKIVRALEARAKSGAQLEADLQVARTRADAISSELKASQQAVAGFNVQRKYSESQLAALRTELDALKTQSNSNAEVLRTREWRHGFDQNMFRELDARVDASDERGGALQVERDQMQAPVAGLDARRVRPAARKPRASARAMGLIAAALVLAVVGWFLVHRAPGPARVLAASSPLVPITGTVSRDCQTCPDMTILPPGRFEQGSARVEGGPVAVDKPLHWVIIGRSLAMSTNVVTVDEFDEFVEATGRDMQGCDTYDGEWKHSPEKSWKDPGFPQTGTHPVTCVSWNDAKAYVQWLSTKTGHRYRLPSASEWEFAARAGSEAVQPWNPDGSGACASANVADQSAARHYPGWAVFACDDGYVYTAPVGSFKTSVFGLNDMLGNVFQWTEDCWNANYTGAPIDGSARTDGDCSEHELRGGSWFSTPVYVRVNYRNHFAAGYRTSSVGIRLVREIDNELANSYQANLK